MILTFILVAYVLMSAVTFTAFGWDKRAARSGRWRIRESTLHFLEALGGFPGAWAGQRVFRHKTVKRSYRFTQWLIVAAHAAAWCWWAWQRN